MSNTLSPEPLGAIPTVTSCSTLRFDYQLHDDGKIYTRPRHDPIKMDRGDIVSTEGDPNPFEWQLFDGIGVPYEYDNDNNKKSILREKEYIADFKVASDIVVAVTNLGRVYMYKITRKDRPLYWESLLGAPKKRRLYLPKGMWDLSCSVCVKDEVRDTSSMHPDEINSYFTIWNADGTSERFDYGFTTTVFVLGEDGRKVTYWDTGLPPSFSRAFILPEGMRGLWIKATGSVVLICTVDSAGKLRYLTYRCDYEMRGPCPGLLNTYETDETPSLDPKGENDSYFLGEGVRHLPMEGIIEHDVDDAIRPHLRQGGFNHLLGKGDNRELGILAEHPEYGWGYYHKNLFDKEWTFVSDPASKPTTEIPMPSYDPNTLSGVKKSYTLDTNNCKNIGIKKDRFSVSALFSNKKEGVADSGNIGKKEKGLSGFSVSSFFSNKKEKNFSEITIELQNFHPFQVDSDPFQIVISCGGVSESISIYPLDAWGLYNHRKHDEDLVGMVDGDPKPLVGTVILTQAQKKLTNDLKSPLGAYIKEYFLPYHQKTKAIPLFGDNGKVCIYLGDNKFQFKREIMEQEILESFYMKKVMVPELMIDDDKPEEMATVLDMNKACQKDMESIYTRRRRKNFVFEKVNKNLQWADSVVKRIFKFKAPSDRTYQQAAEDLKVPTKAHTRMLRYSRKHEERAVGYKQAQRIIKERINALEERIQELKDSSSMRMTR